MICCYSHLLSKSHMTKLEDLLKALLKNGLKDISQESVNCLRTELQYMGNTIFIQGKRVCVKPLHSQIRGNTKVRSLQIQ